MDSIAVQHINTKEIRTYYLNFNEFGDKSQELLDILMDSLLEFVFGIDYLNVEKPQEHQRFFRACKWLYKEKRNPEKEGDLGEIILHTLVRKYLHTIPFTGRFYFAVDQNTNPKSYDVIQVLPNKEKNILVLGESKMYSSAKGGLDALVQDVKHHFTADYAGTQFVRISESTTSNDRSVTDNIILPMKRTIDDWEYKLQTEKTLDNVVDELCVPLLCTYTYNEYANHKCVSDEFLKKYEEEMQELITYFKNKQYQPPKCLSIILMLFPVPDKNKLITEYYKRIDKGCGKDGSI